MKRTLATVAAAALGLAACGGDEGVGGTAEERLNEHQVEYLWISDGWYRRVHVLDYAFETGDVELINEAARGRIDAVDELVAGLEGYDWPEDAQDEVGAYVEAMKADREVYQRVAEAETLQEVDEALSTFTEEVPPANGVRRALNLPQLDPPPEGAGETDPSYEEGWTPEPQEG
ncbi:hypothetical protein [Georgenia sp. AZ-5]|uniref:hypothetical protein n=1 Tax=Georgenia sp. AZ-5 TaxID=3367526 RepID=UPI0037542236